MSLIQTLLSLAAAGSLLLSVPLNTAAPQHDLNGRLFLCNRQFNVSPEYVPEDLVTARVPGQVRKMRADAAAALEEMFAACKEETGKTLVSVSGFRSYATQQGIYRRKLRSVKGDVGRAQAYVAPPGSSEHQLGLAMDIGQKTSPHLNAAFGSTKGGLWCRENCWRFGFILRYNEGWEDITGYRYEPWHFRFVGREYARQIHEAGVPLETWLADYRVRAMTGAVLGSGALEADVLEPAVPEPAEAEPAETEPAPPETADSGTAAETGADPENEKPPETENGGNE